MEKNSKLSPFYIRVISSADPAVEKIVPEQLSPTLSRNHQLRIDRIKKIKKSRCVDSSYYLG